MFRQHDAGGISNEAHTDRYISAGSKHERWQTVRGDLRGVQERRRRTAILVRRAGDYVQPPVRTLPPGDKGYGQVHTGAHGREGYRVARDGDAQDQSRWLAGCDYEPASGPFHRARGEEEPQEGRRETKGGWHQKIRGRASDVPVLPRRVGGLLLHLRVRAPAACQPPRGRRVRRGHRLGLLAPDL